MTTFKFAAIHGLTKSSKQVPGDQNAISSFLLRMVRGWGEWK